MLKRPPHILVTAGPTIEPIDPVRYLTNRSSGKMGYALALAARKAGCRVTLVTGPTVLKAPAGCRVVRVKTAAEMREAVFKELPQVNIVIKAAAVADYRPAQMAPRKLKKSATKLTLKLVKNPDILKELGRKKRPGQILLGFAAETHDVLHHGRKKLVEKNLDWIAINDVLKKGAGFEGDENAVTLVGKNGVVMRFVKQKKSLLARKLVRVILGR